MKRHPSFRFRLVLTAIVAMTGFQCARCATYYWDAIGTGSWTTGTFWSDNAVSGGTTGVVPGSGDSVVFNQSTINGGTTVQMTGATTILGMTFVNSGSTLISGNSTLMRTLTIGSGGITVNAGAGTVNFGNTTNRPVAVALGASQTWLNNSVGLMTFSYNATAGNTVALGANTLTADGSGGTKINNPISGTGAIIKNGTGTLTLNGTNTYTGSTTVNAGTLLVNGDGSAATGAMTVGSGATLGGSGKIGGAVTIQSGGVLAPGNSPGLLTAASLSLNPGSTTSFEINGTGRGTTFDAIDIASGGTLQLGGTFGIAFGSVLADSTVLDLFNFTTVSTGDFNSMTSTGSYAGTWSKTGEIWSLVSGGQTLKFSEITGDLSVIPEPATWMFVAIGLTVVLVLRRRRFEW